MEKKQLVHLLRDHPFILHPEYECSLKGWCFIASKLCLSVTKCKLLWASILDEYTDFLSPSSDGKVETSWLSNEQMDSFLKYVTIPLKDSPTRKASPKKDKPEVKKGLEVKNGRDSQPSFRTHEVKRLQRDAPGPPRMRDKAKDSMRMLFLLRMLPDMVKLSDRQLIRFRIDLLQLIEDVKVSDC